MTWPNTPATEQAPEGLGAPNPPVSSSPPHPAAGIHFTRTKVLDEATGKEVDIFRVSLGDEAIPLLPLRNWGQLDVHKWVARGRLPASPAGLEITPDHVKIAGEVVATKDPDGCAKLEKIFGEWLALEQETLALARKKAQAKPVAVVKEAAEDVPQTLHYQVEMDKSNQVHVRCFRGKELLAAIGLTPSGFKSLFTQGLMRKPHAMQVGALHDWVELDGVLFSFEKGNNDAVKLEQALNASYIPMTTVGQGTDVVFYTNAASSTGFDIQFPVTAAGVSESRKRAFNEDALELLQDPARCGLLHKGVVIKLTRPTVIFKQKTPDGGERYFESCPENLVYTTDEDGKETVIDLSRPVNFLHLTTAELTAVFNHPAIHRHSKAAARPKPAGAAPDNGETQVKPPPSPVLPNPPVANAPASLPEPVVVAIPTPPPPPPPPAPPPAVAPPPPVAVEPPQRRPNVWLAEVLAQPPTRHDWFACLMYTRIAEELGNSSEGTLGLSHCWATALGDVEDVEDPGFKGFFLTDKGGFGFLSAEHIARFNKGVAFLGKQESAIEGIGVSLVALGMDAENQVFFIVADGYRAKFSLPDPAVAQEIARLTEWGATVLSVSEVLESAQPLEVVWTVPARPQDPGEPEVVETRKPEEGSTEENGAGSDPSS